MESINRRSGVFIAGPQLPERHHGGILSRSFSLHSPPMEQPARQGRHWFRTPQIRGDPMRKTVTALATAAIVAVAAVAAPTGAEARWGWGGGWRGPGWGCCWRGPGWGWRGPAFVGGVAAGAVIAGAWAQPYYYGPGYAGYYGCGRPVWNGWRWVRRWAC
jgi:hypothetical protein